MNSRLSAYYHWNILEYLKFVIPPEQRVLFFGYHNFSDLAALRPSHGVMVEPVDTGSARTQDAQARFETHIGFSLEEIRGEFDYIILGDILGFCDDIGDFMRRLGRLCTPDTRILILHHRYIFSPLLRLAERAGLKRPGGLANLLSWRDIRSYMSASGFEPISQQNAMLCPLHLGGLGRIINLVARILPVFDWAKLYHYSIFRPTPAPSPATAGPSLTVCLTCRNERDCIEPLVRAIPAIADEQEILFVEGHSTDGTREEIERVIGAYPEKSIRVIGQPGIGQGDAIREGFSQARGDIIILLEADMTSPPTDIAYVYECLKNHQGEFLEGSRFVYPLSPASMPYINQAGNWFFALIFGWLFRQHITDVLSGIKAIHKRNFQKLLMRWGTWGIEDPFGDFELLFGAMRLGLKGVELPIHYQPRPYGESKTRVIGHGWMLLKMAMVAWSKFRR